MGWAGFSIARDQGSRLQTNDLVELAQVTMGAATLPSAFQAIAARHAECIAVICGPAVLTYRELEERSSQLAGRLTAESGGTGVVAILLDRSVEMVVAMLAVGKAGKAYLPIDVGYPAARVAAMLKDARPEIVVTERRLAESLGRSGLRVVCVDDASKGSGVGGEMSGAGPDNVAYVLYTSGSTGTPKGVQVTHRNVLRLLTSTRPWFKFGPDDVWTMFHSFAFDFSVWEMWGPLLTGGRLVIVPFEVSRSPEEFYALLREQRVTVLNQTPSAFQLLMQVEERLPDADRLTDLRYVIFGGEALRFRALRPWFARHGEVRPQVVNMYGITETTVHVTYRPVSASDVERETESLIGVPIPDLRIYLLDEYGAEVSEGQTGEIYVAGGGVALGYLNRPELTAERFLEDTQGRPGARMYRSGDLARRRADGEMVYLGRGDGQVKVNGFRIELGEVEAALMNVPGVTQGCVQPIAGADESARLAAYFVSSGGTSAHEIAANLREVLPAHMVPAFYVPLREMPLTGNGKIDREALPAPVTGSGFAVATPRSSMEDLVMMQWREVLETERVGVEDNFFEIGGSSLFLIAVRTGLEKRLNWSIPITWLFEHTTVRTLAARLSNGPEGVPVAKPSEAEEKATRQRAAFARTRTAKQGSMERGSWTS